MALGTAIRQNSLRGEKQTPLGTATINAFAARLAIWLAFFSFPVVLNGTLIWLRLARAFSFLPRTRANARFLRSSAARVQRLPLIPVRSHMHSDTQLAARSEK